MKLGRIFVTVSTLLSLAYFVACTGRLETHQSKQNELVSEGNAKLKEILALQTDLAVKYGIVLDGKPVSSTSLWQSFSKEQRRDIQSKLAAHLGLLNRVLEIDAQKNITIENREQLTQARDSAQSFQESIENFEKIYGVNFQSRTTRRTI